MSPSEAYEAAKNNPNVDIEKCQEIACKNSYRAYLFARDVPEQILNIVRKLLVKNHIKLIFLL